MHRLSALEIHHQFMTKKVSAQEIASFFLQRIQEQDSKVGAFLEVFPEDMNQQARLLDEKLAQGKPLGKMAGVPIAIKDNIHIKGKKTTCGSKFLADYKALFDASVTSFLTTEDALLIGKTNLDEFAMGSSTENSAFKKTKNPWDLSCSPGGSSGGSAAAVAARCCPLSLGSDTGGSIRQPAALTGIVGFKPTYGRVSRYGLVAFASSLDQIGPFATTVSDVAYIMDVIGQPCDKDATHVQTRAQPFLEGLKGKIAPATIGVPRRFLEECNPEVKKNFEASLDVFTSLGYKLVDIDLSLLKYSIAVYYILATAEASTNLARYDGVRYGLRSKEATSLEAVYDLSRQEGFGPEVKNRILLGTYVLSSGYKDAFHKKAQQVRTLIIEQLSKAFESCSMIAMPTSPCGAFPLGSIGDPVQMYLQDIYTIGANLAGLPAISLPSGFTADQKPLGLQLMAPQLQDLALLQAAHQFETATSFHKQIPSLFA